jgi:hypothetical protein
MSFIEIVSDALSNPINIAFVVVIVLLAIYDIVTKKDLKSHIVSIGVLGTFVGIFIGLQEFNPSSMKSSIEHILVGLKTAFFTSIVGMGVSILLSIIEKMTTKQAGDDKSILVDISNKLDNLDNSKFNSQLIQEFEKSRDVHLQHIAESKKISEGINLFQNNFKNDNQILIKSLNSNFDKMNSSLEVAIEHLSKGATQEIINALKNVITDFNKELNSQFGENFVKLNDAVGNLVVWQDQYKGHLKTMESTLKSSMKAIEKSNDSFSLIASRNGEVLDTYSKLHRILDINGKQIDNLNSSLKTYSDMSLGAKSMVSAMSANSVSLEKSRKEFELMASLFKQLGEEIPRALQISLDELDSGLSSITSEFQRDYQKILDEYKGNL